MSIFKGSATAMITPFKNNAIDFDAFGKLIDYQLNGGTDALVICGTTGEAPTLDFDEKKSLVAYAVDRVQGRVPVIAGTGTNCTSEVIRMSKAAQEVGADALLIVAPYYNKSTPKGLITHYHTVADSVDMPIIVYNIPSRTGVNIAPATMREIMKHKNIVAVKEASGLISQIAELAATCDCDIYSGNDDQVLPILSLGGCGVISTVSNIIPRDMHDLCASFFERKTDEARRLQLAMIPLIRAAFCEVNPIPIKTMMSLIGMCEGTLRLPLVPPVDTDIEFIKKAMKEYGLI